MLKKLKLFELFVGGRIQRSSKLRLTVGIRSRFFSPER